MGGLPNSQRELGRLVRRTLPDRAGRLGALTSILVLTLAQAGWSWQRTEDELLPFPPDPLIESLFDVKSREVRERLRSVIQSSVRNLSRESAEIRSQAQDRLVSLNRAARPAVEAAVRGENRVRAVSAILTLSRMGGQDPKALLINILKTSDAEEVRATAALVLGTTLDPDLGPILSEVLLDKKHDFARIASVLAVARMKNRNQSVALIQVVKRQGSSRITAACLLALGQIGAPGDSYRLIRDHLDDGAEIVRRAAVLAIGASGLPRGDRYLIPLLADPEDGVLIAALSALAVYADDPNIHEILNEAFLRGKTGRSRAIALRSLIQIGSSPRSEELIILGFRSSPVEVRRAAAALASGFEGESLRIHLTKSLEDDDPSVRGTAALSLGILGEKVDPKILVNVFNDERDEEARLDMALTLANLIPKQAQSVIQRQGARPWRFESRVAHLLRVGPAGKDELSKWLTQRLKSRGPSGSRVLNVEINRLALSLLGLDNFSERGGSRRDNPAARTIPPHLTDLRRWLIEHPYFGG